jgi:hypothetical protein
MDFLKPEYNIIIGGQLTNVHESVKNPFLLKEAQWFSPNHSEIGTSLTEVFTNYKKYQPLGKRQGYYSKENFSWNNMKSLLSSILEKNIPEFPKEIKLSLPKLTLPKL